MTTTRFCIYNFTSGENVCGENCSGKTFFEDRGIKSTKIRSCKTFLSHNSCKWKKWVQNRFLICFAFRSFPGGHDPTLIIECMKNHHLTFFFPRLLITWYNRVIPGNNKFRPAVKLGHSQLSHMRIRYHFISNLHINKYCF